MSRDSGAPHLLGHLSVLEFEGYLLRRVLTIVRAGVAKIP